MFDDVPEETAQALNDEIQQARKEIAELQNRIRDMAIRRESAQAKKARERTDPRVSRIDEQLARAREVLKKFPTQAPAIQPKIKELETERHGLLIALEDEGL